MKRSEDLDRLAAHYDGVDTSEDLRGAVLDTATVDEPMVGITLRLPASTLAAARTQARFEGVKVTALLRRWVEQRLAEGTTDDQVISVGDLKRLIARSAHDRRAG
ncbi:hypothetical protein IC607_03455 [Cellulomonas sp. JH27-2]|uniref:hypothetical protein n=1 Tax=Cellulomonas sp. JH27-2 TaxID=2774139 RepID=UPI00177FB348|nr:hypothetical protein [Cellulomonas sp. JH27-2]MBD8058021.1 hypothetical protein [Cellulomonas sp. JH27-2]